MQHEDMVACLPSMDIKAQILSNRHLHAEDIHPLVHSIASGQPSLSNGERSVCYYTKENR